MPKPEMECRLVASFPTSSTNPDLETALPSLLGSKWWKSNQYLDAHSWAMVRCWTLVFVDHPGCFTGRTKLTHQVVAKKFAL